MKFPVLLSQSWSLRGMVYPSDSNSSTVFTGCTWGRGEVKRAFVKSMIRLACQRQKPCLPSMLMELVMLRSEQAHPDIYAVWYFVGCIVAHYIYRGNHWWKVCNCWCLLICQSCICLENHKGTKLCPQFYSASGKWLFRVHGECYMNSRNMTTPGKPAPLLLNYLAV